MFSTVLKEITGSLDRRFLQSVAEQSGGRYYPLADIGDLPDDAVWLPGNTGGVNVNRDLASPGSPVRVTGGAA